MSQAKRPANDAFASNQLVKRAKSDANLDSTAVAISSGTGQNGALIRAVCAYLDLREDCAPAEHGMELTGAIGTARRCSSVTGHGIDRPFWGSLRGTIRPYRSLYCLRIYGSFHLSVGPRSMSLIHANEPQCSGEALAHAIITVFSVGTSRLCWIFTGRGTRKYCFLHRRICTLRVGTLRLARG